MRVGIGFDTHRFTFGRTLVLGGIHIPFSLGLEGHSDADVVCHAVVDALLGSIAAEDIGTHFPDTDEQYRDISSILLVEKTARLLEERGVKVKNLDIMVLLEEPKLAPYRDQMRQKIAQTLGIDINQVSIKATTTEGLGFTGRGEGIAAQAVVLVEEV